MLSDLLTSTAPKYKTKLHGTGEVVFFRPFLVKEEKALLLALEEKDPSVIMKSICEIISSCYESVKNPIDLPVYEIENLFLQLRSKSVGEEIELSFEDDETGEIVEKKISINDIQLSSEPEDGILELTKELKVKFRYPILKDFLDDNVDLDTTDGYYNLISKCLTSIETKDEFIDVSVRDISEVKDFLESMNKTQFLKVIKYFKDMPKLEYEIEYSNANGKQKKIKLEGIQDFFGLPSVTLV